MEAVPVQRQISEPNGGKVHVLPLTLSELCYLLPLEADESTESATISHLYPFQPTGHLDEHKPVSKQVLISHMKSFFVAVLR